MRKDKDGEGRKRDNAIQRVARNPSNNFDLILIGARHWLLRQPVGTKIVAGEVFSAVMDRNPNLEPYERRVMGPIMKALSREKIIVRAGISNRERSHRGFATEWRRLPA